MAHHVAGAQCLAYGHGLRAVCRDDVEHPRGHAGALRQLGGGQGGERGQLGRFDDHGAACRKCRCHLAGDHGQGEVPRRDGCAHANGLLQHQQPLVVVEGGQGFTVDALGLLGEPFDEAGAVGDFALGLGQGLALFGGHEPGQVVLVRHEQVVPLAQDGAALLDGLGAPGRPRGVGGGDGRFGLLRAEIRHIGQSLPCGRVVDGEAAAACNPLPVDEAIGLEQAGVFQQ